MEGFKLDDLYVLLEFSINNPIKQNDYYRCSKTNLQS